MYRVVIYVYVYIAEEEGVVSQAKLDSLGQLLCGSRGDNDKARFERRSPTGPPFSHQLVGHRNKAFSAQEILKLSFCLSRQKTRSWWFHA
jgi:hypothetical protein